MEIDSSIQTEVAGQLQSLAKLPAQQRVEACHSLLNDIASQSSSPEALEANLTAYLAFILDSNTQIAGVDKPSESLGLISSRPLLSSFIAKLRENSQNDLKLTLVPAAIRLIEPRRVSFEDQDAELKLVLAEAQELDEDWVAAARTLDTINLTTSSRAVTDEHKADIWVRIARCYLEDNDPTLASSYINRARNVIYNVSTPAIRLNYQLSQARILDSQRSFLDASRAYHDISYELTVDEEDRNQSLAAAINCVALAPAGPQRSRLLAKLYKDERASEMENYNILENIFFDRMLDAEEVQRFTAKLQPHQKAQTSDGSTVVERAMLEHNLLGASRIYRNIGTEQLGVLLGTSGERAEEYAAQMIEQRRLLGHIDQVEQVIFFEGQGDEGTQPVANTAGLQELRRWDENVQGLAEEVEKVTTMIQGQFPDFYAANMVH